jgi:hypothetical protein
MEEEDFNVAEKDSWCNLDSSQALPLFNATAQQQANYSASSTLPLPMVSTEPLHALKKLNIHGH